MNKTLYFGIFIMFIVGFFLGNHIILKNIFNVLSIPYYNFYSFLFLLIIPTTWIIHKFTDARYLFGFAMNYAYFIFFMAFAFFFTWPLGEIIPILLGIVLMLFSIITSSRSKIKEIKIKGPTNLKIAHISDLHINSIGSKWKIKIIQKMIKKANPDIILVTGDIVDRPSPKREIVQKLKTNIPTYYILGNHDLYFKKEESVSLIEEAGYIHANKAKIPKINLYGIDDDADNNKIIEEIKKIKPKGFSILMCHKPENVELAAKKGFNLMLSGHTHAGQIFPVQFIVRLLYKNWRGYKKIGNMILNINPGVALVGSHWRFFSKNELTLIKIQKKN